MCEFTKMSANVDTCVRHFVLCDRPVPVHHVLLFHTVRWRAADRRAGRWSPAVRGRPGPHEAGDNKPTAWIPTAFTIGDAHS